MVIYGVALLSFCYLMGMFAGDLLGQLMGVQANVGGVGIAMILLLVLPNLGSRDVTLSPITEKGIGFWSAELRLPAYAVVNRGFGHSKCLNILSATFFRVLV